MTSAFRSLQIPYVWLWAVICPLFKLLEVVPLRCCFESFFLFSLSKLEMCLGVGNVQEPDPGTQRISGTLHSLPSPLLPSVLYCFLPFLPCVLVFFYKSSFSLAWRKMLLHLSAIVKALRRYIAISCCLLKFRQEKLPREHKQFNASNFPPVLVRGKAIFKSVKPTPTLGDF